MRTRLLASVVGLAFAGFGPIALAQPAWAASNAVPDNGASQNKSGQQLIEQSVRVVHQIRADHRFADYLKNAKGVFLMPDLVKAAFLVGGEGAQGVLLKHNSNGTWSDPVFLTIGSISVGAEAGGKAGPAAFLLMSEKALNDFTQANNFSLNANAGLTVIGYSAAGQAPVGKGDVIIWSDQSGAFAGASISGADINTNTTEDRAYYRKQVTPHQIFDGVAKNAGADRLRSALAG